MSKYPKEFVKSGLFYKIHSNLVFHILYGQYQSYSDPLPSSYYLVNKSDITGDVPNGKYYASVTDAIVAINPD